MTIERVWSRHGIGLFFYSLILVFMGQYHKLVNFDKKETVSPHNIGLGLKQAEHTLTVASLADVLYILTTTSPNRGGGDLECRSEYEDRFQTFGRWVGDRVAVFGDYTQAEDVPFLGFRDAKDLHSYVESFIDISDSIVPAFSLAFGVKIGGGGRELNSEEWSWLFPEMRSNT